LSFLTQKNDKNNTYQHDRQEVYTDFCSQSVGAHRQIPLVEESASETTQLLRINVYS